MLCMRHTFTGRYEWWDTRLFAFGFTLSILVTIASAINIGGFMSSAGKHVITTIIVLMSSVATAALALRVCTDEAFC
jgi:hypothetical protein